MRKFLAPIAAFATTVVCVPMLLVGAAAQPAAAAPAPYTIALIVTETGLGAAGYAGAAAGFDARVALQNSEGGVDGHKLVPLVIDDQTTQVVTAMQYALSKHPIGIVADSALFSSAAKYAQQTGLPVTGESTDGPEWGEQPYTNMFSSDGGPVNPNYPVNAFIGKMLKLVGAKVLGTYGYAIAPNSVYAARAASYAFQRIGGTVGVEDTSVPFGTVDFTTEALSAKQQHVDTLWPNLLDSSDYALAQAFEQAGLKLKAAIFPVGYAPSVIHSPAWSSLQGLDFETQFEPFDLPNAGTKEMQAALDKYAHFTKSQFPTFAQYESWLGADLMINGIHLAGPHATPTTVIKALRTVKSYTANGILPVPQDYATGFGKDPEQCHWLMKAEKNGFTPLSPKPICGTDIPGSNLTTASSS
jgi:ABC-type branched-subunit amino acid transport system substrate-binding protein